MRYVKPLSEVKPSYDFFSDCPTGCEEKWWYGIEGITFIYMGSWSDSYIGYKDYAINSCCIEDTMWERYNDECPAPPYQSEEYRRYEADFAAYMREKRDEVFELIEDLISETIKQQ